MAKGLSFLDKTKQLKRTSEVNFATDAGEVVSFKVVSVKDSVLDALREKYDEMKPPVPTKKIPAKGGFKVVTNEEEPAYKKEVAKINRLHYAHMALVFLAPEETESLEGTDEEKVQELLNVELAGFIGKIVTKGLEISGITSNDEEIEEGK